MEVSWKWAAESPISQSEDEVNNCISISFGLSNGVVVSVGTPNLSLGSSFLPSLTKKYVSGSCFAVDDSYFWNIYGTNNSFSLTTIMSMLCEVTLMTGQE
jgi:hypothetical protein